VGTFAHVKDIARAHVVASEKGGTGENYLLGGVEASFREMIEEIARVTGSDMALKDISRFKLKIALFLSTTQALFNGREPLITYPKYRRLTGRLSCDDSKAVRELGFSTTTVQEMVTDCCQWLRREGLLQSY
jgi:dihydroflavonol-4-reductase